MLPDPSPPPPKLAETDDGPSWAPFFFWFQRGLAVATALRRLARYPKSVSEPALSLTDRPWPSEGRIQQVYYFQCVGVFEGAPFSKSQAVSKYDANRGTGLRAVVLGGNRWAQAGLRHPRRRSAGPVAADLVLAVGAWPADICAKRQCPEFVAKDVRGWIEAVGARTAFIEPGSPWENGYVESFNARFRDELLNREVFYSLREAQIVIENWRKHYNTKRPHSALGYRPPAPETIVPIDQRPIMH